MPLALYFWYETSNRNWYVAIFAIIIPVLYGYVVPYFGANIMHLWEFKTDFNLGRITVLHGFMFGGASALLALCGYHHQNLVFSILDMLKSGISIAAIIGITNWIFDEMMIKNGFAIVYNMPYFNKENAASITADYAPVYFCTFGFCYGISLDIAEYFSKILANRHIFWFLSFGLLLFVIFTPAAAYLIKLKIQNDDVSLKKFLGKTK